MIKYYVQDNGNAIFVAGIDISLKVILRSIVLIQRPMKRGVIAPGRIALRLLNRHQFNCIDP
ncbi:hypothetical protein D3C80_898150 [compost metagenome]